MLMIHLMTVTKLRWIHWFKFSPLLWPFNLYFPLARQLPDICRVISNASTLCVFRLRRILAEGPNNNNNMNRWERAFRLFCQEVLPSSVRQRPNAATDTILHQMLLTH